jgi:hypothetical protein
LDTLEEIENIKTFFFFVRIFLPISSQVCLGLERIKKGLVKEDWKRAELLSWYLLTLGCTKVIRNSILFEMEIIL